MMTSEERDLNVPHPKLALEPNGANEIQGDQPSKQPEESLSFVRNAVTAAVALAMGVGAFVQLLVRGSSKPPAEEPPPESADNETTENYALLNLLWYALVAMLVTLVAGLGWEAYQGPLRPFILHDLLVSVFATVSGMVWVRMFRTLASEGIIGRKVSRKLIHITSAPLFLLCWPLYSLTPTARVVAALPPLANSIRLLNTGLGKTENRDAVEAISRKGGRRELLQGPLYYVLVLLIATAVGWRTSLASYVSICLMAGGDGLADIVGRRYGTVKLPWNPAKSWAGSVAMFLGGFVLSLGFVTLFGMAGFLPSVLENQFPLRLGLVCLLTTIVESLPNTWWWPLDDNVSVPLVAVVLSATLLHIV